MSKAWASGAGGAALGVACGAVLRWVGQVRTRGVAPGGIGLRGGLARRFLASPWRGQGGGRDGGEPLHLLRFRTALERGASVLQAFEAASIGPGPWSAGARRLVRRVHAGAGLDAAAALWAAEDPDPSVAVLVDALAISGSTGGSHLRAVDAVIAAVRSREALRREVRALASQARASAVVLVVMPVGFAIAIALLDPRVRAFYVGGPAGLLCVAAGAVLDLAGAWVMARMIRRVA